MKKEIRINTKILMSIFTLFVVVLLLGLFGLTYSYYKTQVLGTPNPLEGGITSNALILKYSDSEKIEAVDILPGWTYTKTITITNENAINTVYSLNFTNFTNTFGTGYLVYTITSTNGGCNISETSVPYIHEEPTKINICKTNINAGVTQVYTVTFTYKEVIGEEINYGPDQGKEMSGKIEIGKGTILLFDRILSDNEIKINADFTKSSEESGEYGLYKATAYGKDIYYYRGGDHCRNIDDTLNITYTDKESCETNGVTWVTLNNNIIFADKCWQIIRTNEDGSTRVIYNGLPDNGKCIPQYGFNTQIGYSEFNNFAVGSQNEYHVGYTYGETSHDGTIDSTIKVYLENWYANNMIEYAEKIEDSGFCNDRSIYTSNAYAVYFGSYERLTVNKTPTLECPNIERDLYTVNKIEGNKKQTYPIGLITADEIVYGGSKAGVVTAKNNYLNSSTSYYSLSPNNFSPSISYTSIYYLLLTGHLGFNYVGNSSGVRPVISLKANVTTEIGIGSKNNPYIIL